MGEDGTKGIHSQSLSTYPPYGVFNPGKQRTKVEIPHHGRLFARLRRRVNKGPFSVLLPLFDIPAETTHVAANFFGRFLKGQKDAGLTSDNALRQKMAGEYGFGTAGGAGNQCGAMLGQSAIGNGVESRNSGDKLFHRGGF